MCSFAQILCVFVHFDGFVFIFLLFLCRFVNFCEFVRILLFPPRLLARCAVHRGSAAARLIARQHLAMRAAAAGRARVKQGGERGSAWERAKVARGVAAARRRPAPRPNVSNERGRRSSLNWAACISTRAIARASLPRVRTTAFTSAGGHGAGFRPRGARRRGQAARSQRAHRGRPGKRAGA